MSEKHLYQFRAFNDLMWNDFAVLPVISLLITYDLELQLSNRFLLGNIREHKQSTFLSDELNRKWGIFPFNDALTLLNVSIQVSLLA